MSRIGLAVRPEPAAAVKGHAPVIIQARLSGDAFPQLKQPQPTFNYRN
jgi:hypothetical protein